MKNIYEKIMRKELKKQSEEFPFGDIDIIIYLLIAGIWLTLLLIAFYYA